MLTNNEFDHWVINNKINLETSNYINSGVRNSSPSRNVSGKKNNVTGRYPSKKMGVTIQYESRTVEAAAIHLMENDNDVLEYYDQPNKIKIKYNNEKNRTISYLYTPDFFIIKKNAAGWEEWKTEKELERLVQTKPGLYSKDENGQWRCLPGEKVANEKGLFFKVRSDQELNWILLKNLTFLDSYLKQDKSELYMNEINTVQNLVENKKGCSLDELINQTIKLGLKVDFIYFALIAKKVFIDLEKCTLSDTKNVSVFLSREEEMIFNNIIDSETERKHNETNYINLQQGEILLWDGVKWEIVNVGIEKVTLKSSNQKFLPLTLSEIESLINAGEIIPRRNELIENSSPDRNLEIIRGCSEEELLMANQKYEYVKMYKKGKYKNEDCWPKSRTVRGWVRSYNNAEEFHGNGFVGLLPKIKERGNRVKRYNDKVQQLMIEFIENDYESKKQKNAITVYGSFKTQCEKQGYMVPSYATFCKTIHNRPKPESVEKREGKRSAYNYIEHYWLDYDKTPRHGEFPFHICHLDHTQLDIELVSSISGKTLGRPWISLMVDAFTRRVIAFYLTFNKPSSTSCMMIYRNCVKRFGRLPQIIVVDNGKEFKSIYFQGLVAMYGGEISYRPSAMPRYGSVLERLFGTTNTKLIHNLQGNTKIMKNVRKVTKSFNPKNNAMLTIQELHSLLEDFFYKAYENSVHPSLNGLNPIEAFKQGYKFGEREHTLIPYDETFEILTLPSTIRGVAKVQYGSGIKVNNKYYGSKIFREKMLKVKKLK